MQKFFFDMKDGVPLRDRIRIDFRTNAEAIDHCKELAQHFRDDIFFHVARLISARMDRAAHTNNSAPSVVVTAADSSE